jgi:hypothetical protein
MKTFYLGIDPGLKGGLASMNEDGDLQLVNLANDCTALLEQIRLLCSSAGLIRIALIEEVGGFAGRPLPGSRMFAFGRSYGWAEAILMSFNFEVRHVKPQTWQKALGHSRRANEDKSSSKRRLAALARELWPSLRTQITLQTADASLILYFLLKVERVNAEEKKNTK